MSSGKPGVLVTDPRLLVLGSALAEAFALIDARDEAALAAAAEGIIAILSAGSDPVGAEMMDRLPKLRLIAAVAAGIEGIDLEAARARGIAVTSTGAIGSDDVATHGVAMMLAARQQLLAGDRMVRAGEWVAGGVIAPRRSIASERVGIVGMGAIGRAVARKLAPFCPDIGWWAPRAQDLPWPRRESLIDLARWSSILILCARGDVENHRMIDAEMIAAIGADGLLVNIARGQLVDEDALIAALKAGTLGQAALDVFVEEPTDPARWRDVPNVLLSPHVAGMTFENLLTRRELVMANIRALLTGGELKNIVVPGR